MTGKFSLLRKLLVMLLLGIVMCITGCSKTVVRENILSSIETGIGLTVAENKQTQMYELKAGYIRSQFYSIPTGKVVETDKAAFNEMSTCRRISNMTIGTLSTEERAKVFSILSSCVNASYQRPSNAADVAPELVAGIRAHSGLQDILFGMDISENFAVGKEAVNSPAAVAMYVANAINDKTSEQASGAMLNLTTRAAAVESVPIINKLQEEIKKLSDDTAIFLANHPPVTDEDTETAVKSLYPQNKPVSKASDAKQLINFRLLKAQRDISKLRIWENILDAYGKGGK